MIRHDLTLWPLVLSCLSGPMTLEDQLAFFAEWTGWLDRGERFATLRVFADAEALERPEGGSKAAKSWLQANAERVKSQVMGMATVVPIEVYDEVSRMDAEKLFRVPAQTFSEVERATEWLEKSLPHPYDVSLDWNSAHQLATSHARGLVVKRNA